MILHGKAYGRRLTRRRRTPLLLGAAAACVAVLATATVCVPLASAATHPRPASAPVPTSAVVGTGLVTCARATGEVGYTVPSISGGGSGTAEVISIWFDATKCEPAAGGDATPVPASVIGSMSFNSNQGDACPLTGTLGTPSPSTYLSLAYNFPPVAATVIDPSVVTDVGVTQTGAYWKLSGSAVLGSYPASSFSAELKPVPIGTQTCTSGITSEYITRLQGTLTF
jgi:hypothetical protein